MIASGWSRVGNLPQEATSLVGRRREVADITRLLLRSRMVTLTGPGGVGKSRLAVRVAARLQPMFADGAWLVDVTELHQPGPGSRPAPDLDAVARLVADMLRLPDRGGKPLQMVTHRLAASQRLLTLDGCEPLIEQCAVLAHALLDTCPRLRILATSREPLAITGETVVYVPPLPTAGPHPGQYL